MNESLFVQAGFDRALPLDRPDFGVLLTLAALRQAHSPTARSALALRARRTAPSGQDAMALLAGEPANAAGHVFSASFHDLGGDAAGAAPESMLERAVNLGISTYVQTPPVDLAERQAISRVFEDL